MANEVKKDKSAITNNATAVDVTNAEEPIQLPELEVTAARRPMNANFATNNVPNMETRKIEVETPAYTPTPPTEEENTEEPQATENTEEQAGGASGVYVPTDPTNDVDTSTQLRFETPVATPKATRKRRWTDAFFERKQPGETDNEGQARRERNSKRIAAIGDLARAVANQYYTAKGGLNTYDTDNTLFGNVDKYQKDMEERRRKNEDSYFSRYIQQRNMELKENKQRADEEIKKAQQDLKEAKWEYEQKKLQLELEISQGNLDKVQADARRKQIEAEYAERRQQAALAESMARQGYWNAATGAQNSLANKRDTEAANVGKGKSGSSSGGSSGSGSSSGGSKKGKKTTFPTEAAGEVPTTSNGAKQAYTI